MAKKVRPKAADATPAEPSFQFPVFDEKAFVTKEYEVTLGMVVTGLLSVVVGIASWAVTAALASFSDAWVLSVLIGFAGLLGLHPLVNSLHPRAHVYTKGDWAGLMAVVFFGWLAIWFMLSDIVPRF